MLRCFALTEHTLHPQAFTLLTAFAAWRWRKQRGWQRLGSPDAVRSDAQPDAKAEKSGDHHSVPVAEVHETQPSAESSSAVAQTSV